MREFSQIRLITLLIITERVEIERHMVAFAHINPHRERGMFRLLTATLLSAALPNHKVGQSV